MKNILIILGAIFLIKIAFTLLCFLFTPVIFFSLAAIGLLAKSGVIGKLFRPKKSKNHEVVIEVEPINIE